MSGATLDAGALIALERGDRFMLTLLTRANETGTRLAIPAGALAQAWRDGRQQARLAKLLKSPIVDVIELDEAGARGAGQLCGAVHTDDVVDASVVLCARQHRHPVITSDPDDLRRLDADLELVRV